MAAKDKLFILRRPYSFPVWEKNMERKANQREDKMTCPLKMPKNFCAGGGAKVLATLAALPWQGFAGHLILFEAGCRPLKLPRRWAFLLRRWGACFDSVAGNRLRPCPCSRQKRDRAYAGKDLLKSGGFQRGKNSCFPPLACFSFATSFCTSKKKWRVPFFKIFLRGSKR